MWYGVDELAWFAIRNPWSYALWFVDEKIYIFNCLLHWPFTWISERVFSKAGDLVSHQPQKRWHGIISQQEQEPLRHVLILMNGMLIEIYCWILILYFVSCMCWNKNKKSDKKKNMKRINTKQKQNKNKTKPTTWLLLKRRTSHVHTFFQQGRRKIAILGGKNVYVFLFVFF